MGGTVTSSSSPASSPPYSGATKQEPSYLRYQVPDQEVDIYLHRDHGTEMIPPVTSPGARPARASPARVGQEARQTGQGGRSGVVG